MKKRNIAIAQAMLSAGLFAVSMPVSKILLKEIPPAFLAALLYIGAGSGMSFLAVLKKSTDKVQKEARLSRRDFPYIFAMIALDIAAPVLLMFGLSKATPANVSLLSNFEIAATSLVALIIFKEPIGKRIWASITLITVSCLLLSFENLSSLSFSSGSLLVLFACLFWGLENNCTKMLSLKDPAQIVILKGFGSGIGSLIIALSIKTYTADLGFITAALILGFVSYGLSIFFYIKSQRELGAARTSSYYATAPFIGVILSLLFFRQSITLSFIIAAMIMVLGTYYSIAENHAHPHIHKAIEHEHRHCHDDGHHDHNHDEIISGEHSHKHIHEYIEHTHSHTPDSQHIHSHKK